MTRDIEWTRDATRAAATADNGRSHAEPFSELPVTVAPSPNLLTYYVLASLLFGPAFVIAVIPYYLRYHTMRYEVDEEGITMRWGILFRREISLTYTRIQDIHLSSNFVERWLGLAKIQVQTASGSAAAEMTIEGMPNPDSIRDFLYSKMRGARKESPISGQLVVEGAAGDPIGALTATLREVAAEVRALREGLPGAPAEPDDD